MTIVFKMSKRLGLCFASLLLFVFGCYGHSNINNYNKSSRDSVNKVQESPMIRPASIGIIGDTANVITPTSAGTVLMGGGKDVDSAFRWMIEKSGGGDAVIIRASGADAYNPYIYDLGKLNSVETLKIDSKELANNDTVVNIIRNAELLFIAGGDQSVYMKNWKGTKVADAINYLLNTKKVPVGGTSAGCAILGNYYFSGENGSVTSAEALSNPYNSQVTLYKNDFIHSRYLENVITDQHYITRNRQGRHIVFLSRAIKDWHIQIKGVATDERTAICINEKGIGKVFGSGSAFFLLPTKPKAEVCEANLPLTWSHNKKALSVYQVTGTEKGNGAIDFSDKHMNDEKSAGNWFWWWVEAGLLKTAAK